MYELEKEKKAEIEIEKGTNRALVMWTEHRLFWTKNLKLTEILPL
jgi:hypothetical protein